MRRTRDPEEKRARLMATALQLFKSQGFDATSTAQIAKMAGVSEGILFHQFGSKLDLFKALADEYTENMVARLIPEGHPPGIQEGVMRTLFQLAEDDPEGYTLFAEEGSKLDVFASAHRERLVETVESHLKARMSNRAIHEGDTRIMAELQVTLVLGTYRAWRQTRDPARMEAYIQEGVRSMTAVLARD